jgi:cytidyltransferase-like protein
MVLADGCFDVLHVGHLRYLRAAAELAPGGLCVNIAPDAAIRAKGREPFQNAEERAELIFGLGCVDRVVQFSTLAAAILDLRPAVVAKGEDWRDRLPAEVLEACQRVGARIRYTQTQTRTSTERLAQ